MSDKTINNSDTFRIKYLSYSKISAILCVLYFLRNFFFLVVFDTCDGVYNWSISLLPTIVLDNLFGNALITTAKKIKKCLFLLVSPLFLMGKISASHFCRETKMENKLFK